MNAWDESRERNHTDALASRPRRSTGGGHKRGRPWILVALAGCGAVVAGMWFLVPAMHRVPGSLQSQPAQSADSRSAVRLPPIAPKPEVAALIKEAQQVAARLAAQYPDAAGAHDVNGWMWFRFGKSAEAVKCWQKCLELDPGFARAWYWLGVCAFEHEDYERAAACFRKNLELEPRSVTTLVHLANALIKAGKMQEALAVLEQGRQLRPDFVPTLVLLGQTYLHQKRYDEAEKTLRRAIAVAPDYTNAYYGLATVCARLGRKEEARAFREQFRMLKRKDYQAERAALKAYEDIVPVREGVAVVYTSAARVYLAHGDIEEAEKHWLRAAELDGNAVECRMALASLYREAGRKDDALPLVRELVRIDLEHPAQYLELARLCTSLGQMDLAEQSFRSCIERAPNQAVGYSSLAGWLLQSPRRLDEAQSLAEKAVALEPSAQNYALLGTICQRRGDHAGARAAWQHAVQLDPTNPRYVQMYNRLRQMGRHERL